MIDEDEMPIRAFREDGSGEFRYHMACVGITPVMVDEPDAPPVP